MNNLTKLGKKYGTDKCSKHKYTEVYEKFFGELTNNEIVLMEIGVLNGASIRMWLDYFPNAQIIGMDINMVEFKHKRFHFVRASQRNEIAIDGIIDYVTRVLKMPGFDIIVDDGSHVSDDQQYTYEMLNRFVNNGGFYCIEDLQCIRESNTVISTYDVINAYAKSGKSTIISICDNVVHLGHKLALLQRNKDGIQLHSN